MIVLVLLVVGSIAVLSFSGLDGSNVVSSSSITLTGGSTASKTSSTNTGSSKETLTSRTGSSTSTATSTLSSPTSTITTQTSSTTTTTSTTKTTSSSSTTTSESTTQTNSTSTSTQAYGIGAVTRPPAGANYPSGAEYPTGPKFARFRVYQSGWTSPQYDAQQILSMISQLRPNVLERMTTNTFNVGASVPACSGCQPMTYGQFLNASMSACGCYIIPRLDINSTWTAGTFLSDAKEILSTPVSPRFAMLSIDNWSYFCSKVASCTCAMAQQIFQPLYAMGWKGVGVLNAGLPYYSTCGWATFIDLDVTASNWTVPQTLLSSIKSDNTVQKILLYDPDFPGRLRRSYPSAIRLAIAQYLPCKPRFLSRRLRAIPTSIL